MHHHYLKGSLLCGRCHRAGQIGRMTIQRTVNSQGSEYFYFFCRLTQTGACQSPHVNVLRVEDAVERYCETVRFAPGFAADVRAHIAAVMYQEQKATRLLHKQLTSELQVLDAQEET